MWQGKETKEMWCKENNKSAVALVGENNRINVVVV